MFQRFSLVAVLLPLLASGQACGSTDSAPDDLERACDRLAQCPQTQELGGANPARACRDDLSSRYDEASGYGCAAAYADVVACYATSSDVCSADGEIESCQDVQAAFRDCQGRAGKDECVIIADLGGTACEISCALFDADCPAAAADAPQACSCSTGQHAGASFSAPACDDRLEAAARAACQ